MRVFRAERRVRLSDADPSGRLRLDAVARYLHDVSNDDTRDSGLRDDGSWVVRRTVVRVEGASPRYLQRVALATWCSGTGRNWAERTVTIGDSVVATSLWVAVDLDTMRPRRLDDDFLTLYAPSANGRRVSSRLLLPGPDGHAGAAHRRPWPLRRTDLDLLGHVNNAAYWAAVEGVAPDLLAAPYEATLEFARPVDWGADVQLAVAAGDGELRAWFEVDGAVHASACVAALPAAVPAST